MKRFLINFCLISLLTIVAQPLFSQLRFEPEQLLLPSGTEAGFEVPVTVFNDDSRILQIDFVVSGEDWTVLPSSLEIEAYGKAEFTISAKVLHPGDAAAVLMLSDRDDVPYMYSILPFSESPDASGGRKEDGPDDGDTENERAPKPFLFFFSPGCEICEIFYATDLPALENETGISLKPEKLNIFESRNFEYLESLASERGVEIKDFPILIAGNSVFSGEKGIRREFPEALRKKDGGFSTQAILEDGNEAESVLPGLRWLPVFLAGLLDGINPCAFTSLIFLISYLRLLNKKGSDILKIGGSFTLAVFLTYFLIGLGAFRFIRMADSFTLLSSLIRYILGGLLLVLAVLSMIDFFRVRRGRASDSILQLSSGTKSRIHRVVRTSSRSSLVYASSFLAGFLISLYELGCTGQIYLPMLVYMVRQESWTALAPLILYNIAFILPLVLVFLIFYRGSDSRKISDFFQKHLGLIKLASGVLFLFMGLFILLF